MKIWKHCTFVAVLTLISLLFIACEGPMGPQGEQGFQGEKGETGIQGEKGDTGTQGEKGDTGVDGKDGFNAYLVIFDSNGGIPMFNLVGVNHGNKVTPINPVKVGYNCIFDGWYVDNITFNDKWNFETNSVTTNTTLYAKWIPYELGATGPGGGIIFYRNEKGFIMTDDNSTAHYLEAAPVDIPNTLEWASSSFGSFNITGTETVIGAGRKNTFIILENDQYAPAANACIDYVANGKSDWFLPSKDELNELYVSRDLVGNLLGVTEIRPFGDPILRLTYWSSSQAYIVTDDWTYTEPWIHDFETNIIWYNFSKTGQHVVRALRAF